MIYDNLKKYKNLIVISILILIILFLYFKNKKEHLLVGIEPVLNITKLYADASGTATFNNLQVTKLTANELDISGTNKDDINTSNNITVKNIKIYDNLDISGSINILTTRAYYTCVVQGTLNLPEINKSIIKKYTSHMNIIARKWWNSDRKITNVSNDKNNTITNDITNGIFTRFDKNKVYKLEAYIHLYVVFNTSYNIVDKLIARWVRDNGGEELSNVCIQLSKNTYNIVLSTIIIATGSDSYTLTLQKYGMNTYYYEIQSSIIIAITEL